MIKRFTVNLIFLFLSFNFALAQDLHYELSENAGKMFSIKNYLRAKELYQTLHKSNLKNLKYKYRYGISLIYSYEYKKGLKILEEVADESSAPVDIDFYLGRAYHLNNKYALAIKRYEDYIKRNKGKNDLILQCKRNITTCNNAKELIEDRLNVSFENLGEKINSKGNDYSPYTTPDEDFLLFTTRREGTTGRIYDLQNYYPCDIYLTKYKHEKWNKARPIGYPNSYGNEEVVGMSENGKYVLYHVDNPNSESNLQISEKSKLSFKRSNQITSDQINNPLSDQLSITVSNDYSYYIFSSDRPEGIGGHDLYICKRLPNGKWGEPFNMGRNINTPYDEAFPYLTDNGYTLYFASKGHNSMGGYDIFKSTFDTKKKEWLPPINIGYPINTAGDNTTISFNKTKKYAYVSAYRNDSYGNLDIYRVNFEDTLPQYSLITGYVLDPDSNLFNAELDITIYEKGTEEVYGIYKVNANKNKYVFALPPNEYEVIIDTADKGSIIKPLSVKGRNRYQKEINENIYITPNGKNPDEPN